MFFSTLSPKYLTCNFKRIALRHTILLILSAVTLVKTLGKSKQIACQTDALKGVARVRKRYTVIKVETISTQLSNMIAGWTSATRR